MFVFHSRRAVRSVSQLQAGQGPVPGVRSCPEEDAGSPQTAHATR